MENYASWIMSSIMNIRMIIHLAYECSCIKSCGFWQFGVGCILVDSSDNITLRVTTKYSIPIFEVIGMLKWWSWII